MRIPRIYHPARLEAYSTIKLSDDAVNHVGRVLRMAAGDRLELFDGSNHIFAAQIVNVTKKAIEVSIEQRSLSDKESPLNLHLGQVISRGDKMEFTIQKSIELGVNAITPLLSERCGVKLDAERMNKKLQQWRKIAVSACEQCGRNRIPTIREVQSLQDWCIERHNGLKLNLHPRATHSVNTLPATIKDIRLLVGPEGGLSEQEIDMTAQRGFIDILLGPRVLRTETAALTAITALQTRFGDLG